PLGGGRRDLSARGGESPESRAVSLQRPVLRSARASDAVPRPDCRVGALEPSSVGNRAFSVADRVHVFAAAGGLGIERPVLYQPAGALGKRSPAGGAVHAAGGRYGAVSYGSVHQSAKSYGLCSRVRGFQYFRQEVPAGGGVLDFADGDSSPDAIVCFVLLCAVGFHAAVGDRQGLVCRFAVACSSAAYLRRLPSGRAHAP